MFKVHKRKIHVWLVQNSNIEGSQHQNGLVYMYSSNAYRTCRDAIIQAENKYPGFKFRAGFARD